MSPETLEAKYARVRSLLVSLFDAVMADTGEVSPEVKAVLEDVSTYLDEETFDAYHGKD